VAAADLSRRAHRAAFLKLFDSYVPNPMEDVRALAQQR